MANIQITGLVEDTSPSATDVLVKEDSGGISTNKTPLQYVATAPQVHYMYKAATELTISSDEITVTQSAHKLQPETGTSDDLATISGTVDGESGILFITDEGTDTITIKHGTGNIDIVGGSDLDLSNGAVFWYSDGTTIYVIGGGGGGGGGGGLVPGGRITLTTGIPVTTANVTAATTIYYTPYVGNDININGTALTFSETSVSVPATTVTPFDIFAYNNSGTLALETLNWTNDTTRATAIAIAGDGRYYKSGDTTRLYLGTGRTTGVSGQTQSTTSSRLLWNMYNQIDRAIQVKYEASHAYTTGSYRAWNANTTLGQAKTEFLIGLSTLVDLIMSAAWEAYDTNDVGPRIAIGLDSVTASFGSLYIDGLTASGADLYGYSIPYKWYCAAGYHYMQASEYGYSPSGNALYVGQHYSWMG